MSDNIELSIQPAYNVINNKIDYAEILVRKYMNIDGAQRVLQYVRDTETELEFDLRVLEETLKYIKNHPDLDYPIGVNLCPRTITLENAYENIIEMINNYNIHPDSIVIEINEDSDFSNNNTFENIKQLRTFGIAVALDDFGTSNANFQSLLRDSFDVIKIDKKFIDYLNENDAEHENSGNAILTSMLKLCKMLGVKSIVEGIESYKQLEYTKKMGCNSIQGYIYCKPIPLKDYK